MGISQSDANIDGIAMAWLRNRFSDRDYKPTSSEYLMAWQAPFCFTSAFRDYGKNENAWRKLMGQPELPPSKANILFPYHAQFPGRHTVSCDVGIYDPNDTVASMSKRLFSLIYMKFILYLSVGSALVVLSFLIRAAAREKRNRLQKKQTQTPTLPFSAQPTSPPISGSDAPAPDSTPPSAQH